MNKVVLIGRLTKDIELKYIPGEKNTAVATFSLAVNRNFKNKDGNYDADFINCTVFGKTAETMSNNLSKGRQIAVEGRIQVRNYEANDGTKRYVTEVVVNEFQFLDKKQNGSSSSTPSESDGFDTADDDSIPF